MKRVLLGGLSVLLATALPAIAGVNGGGSIIVHTDDTYTYRATTVCTTTQGQPADCASAVTQANNGFNEGVSQVVWFLASFVPEASPRVASVYFGMSYNGGANGFIDRQNICGPSGSLEAPDSGWPSDTAGNSVGFGSSPVVGNTLFRFYYFVASDSDPGSSLCSKINPTGGYAAFFDDGFPPSQDNVTRFGCVNWYTAGSNTCPVPPPTGACCVVSSASCVVVGSRGQCDDLSGTYQGDGTQCDKPCSVCCYWSVLDSDYTRQCTVTMENDCLTNALWNPAPLDVAGIGLVGSGWAWVDPTWLTGKVCTFLPEQAHTEPYWFCIDPRLEDPSTPIEPSSWGKLKALYR